MIKAVYVKNGDSATESQLDNITGILEQKPRMLWLDITIENNEFTLDEIALLTETFKFHELSVEDCLFPQYHPKIEEFENYVFCAVHGISPKAKDFSNIETAMYELDLFVGKEFVVTVHAGELPEIDALFEKARLKPQIELRSLENLLYNIFRRIAASFESVLDKMGDRFDEIEDRILQDPTTELMSEIFELKKVLVNFRKVTEPQKNIYSFFARETNGIISRRSAAYFRDIYDQFDRINQSITSHTQMIGSMLEMYVSNVTLKLNEVIKFLTIIATIGLPAVFIASYYGMNVQFPEHRILGDSKVWYFAMFIIAASTIAIFAYIKKKKWL